MPRRPSVPCVREPQKGFFAARGVEDDRGPVSKVILGRHLPVDLPRISGLAIDLRVLAFTALISLATGILFGLAPLFQTAHGSANETLKQNARLAGGVQSRLRNG